jgi:hypothetical protein
MSSLKLNKEAACAADNVASGIRESGKYIGIITRAEQLSSDKGTQGLGLSFKADNGQTANYLDLWHTKGNGEALSSLKTVNAILCCAKVAEAREGMIQCEKWNKDQGVSEKVSVTGYPDLMGKRIGLLLQQTLETDQNGKDREKVQIFAVFNADTELTASEIYAKKTKPERLPNMLDALLARPVRDNRKAPPAARRSGAAASSSDDTRTGFSDADLDDVPF